MTCTECGKPGARVRRLDAADHVHYFHLACWRKMLAWLAS